MCTRSYNVQLRDLDGRFESCLYVNTRFACLGLRTSYGRDFWKTVSPEIAAIEVQTDMLISPINIEAKFLTTEEITSTRMSMHTWMQRCAANQAAPQIPSSETNYTLRRLWAHAESQINQNRLTSPCMHPHKYMHACANSAHTCMHTGTHASWHAYTSARTQTCKHARAHQHFTHDHLRLKYRSCCD